MVCSNHDRMVLEVNQGCPRGFGFTLLSRIITDTGESIDLPYDLTGATLKVAVKHAPYINLPNFIEKVISTDSDLNTVGQITDAVNGKFQVQFTEKDVKLKVGEYALVIIMIAGDGVEYHLSGDGNSYAIFRVCYQ